MSTISNSTKNEESASPIMSQKEIKYKSLLTKRRLVPKISSDTDVQCFDGLGGHSKEITRTDRTTLLNAIANSKKILPVPSKRPKIISGNSGQKSDLYKFCIKKT